MKYWFILLLATMVAPSSQISLSSCGPYLRRPERTDISVTCGTSSISLAIEICPVIYTGYNESLLILNYMMNSACGGTVDETAIPPVARFNFPINMTNACGSMFKTTSAPGTELFSDFSNIQTVNISGVVRSFDPTTGTVTYNAELKYFYSCAYPLEYLINNTQLDVSGSSVVVKDSNGSFISTLNMALFCDINCTKPLMIPPLGLELRTNVFAHVKASNLTGQYHILLDRCYASMSPFPTNSTYFNLFMPCVTDKSTSVIENGQSHRARFSFAAFRFNEQRNHTVSSYYLHCIARLCDITTCKILKQCNRRKRSVGDATAAGVSEVHTITSPQIIIKSDSMPSPEYPLTSPKASKGDSTTGLSVAVGILTFTCIAAGFVAAVIYTRLRN